MESNGDLIEVDGAPLSDDLETRAMQLFERAEMLEIRDNESYEAGITTLKRLKRTRVSWKDLNAKAIAAAKQSLEEARELFRKIDNPLAGAYDGLHERCEQYLTRKRVEQRVIAAAPPVQPAAPPPDLGSEFDQAVASGDVAKAQRILSEADKPAVSAIPTNSAPPPPPSRSAVAPKVEGVSVSDSWTYDVVDELMIPEEYWITTRALDKKAIAGVVKSMKGKTNIPGIHARPDTGLRIRA